LTRHADTRPLYLSPKLVRAAVCVPMPLHESARDCLERQEWFVAGTEGGGSRYAADAQPIRLRQPTPGLKLAYDPRLPATAQVFEFVLQGVAATDRVRWSVDGRDVETTGGTYRWSVTRGEHRVAASVFTAGELVARVDETAFHVK
jgi:penicillin-binding protein 1C